MLYPSTSPLATEANRNGTESAMWSEERRNANCKLYFITYCNFCSWFTSKISFHQLYKVKLCVSYRVVSCDTFVGVGNPTSAVWWAMECDLTEYINTHGRRNFRSWRSPRSSLTQSSKCTDTVRHTGIGR